MTEHEHDRREREDEHERGDEHEREHEDPQQDPRDHRHDRSYLDVGAARAMEPAAHSRLLEQLEAGPIGLSVRQALTQVPDAELLDVPDLVAAESKRFTLSLRNPIEAGRGQLYAADSVWAEWTTSDLLVISPKGELAVMLDPFPGYRLVDFGYFCQATSGAKHKVTGVHPPEAKTEAECGGGAERLAVLVKPNATKGSQINLSHKGHQWTFKEAIVHELSL